LARGWLEVGSRLARGSATQIGYTFFMLHYAMLTQLCLARDVLTENTEQKISIKLLAQELGMSQYHFIRLFSAVFGLTPDGLTQNMGES
jgi:AraC-like DNA-binding protein